MFTFIPKLYAVGYSLFVGFLYWLGSQSTAFGLPLPAATNPSSPKSVTAIDPNRCYRLVSRVSGNVLSVNGSSPADGAQILQLTDGNLLSQGWRFTVAEGGYYQIAVLHTQKGIQVAHSATTDNALIEQWTYWGGQHQQWRLERNAEGYFTLVNRNSKKAITVSTASQAEGAQVSQQTLTTGYHQQWSLEERSCTASPPTSATTNRAPVVVATSTSLTGTSPLSVTFTGNQSYDPDGDPIYYEWDFGDGSVYVTEANPVHVFTARTGGQGMGLVLRYTVRLTVIDNKGQRSPTQMFNVVLANNTPTVRITNPVNNARYPLDKVTSYNLAATVTGNGIASQIWQVKLRRNNKEQVVKTASGANPVIDVSPVGCEGDAYFVIAVKVTDAAGQSGQDSVKIYPDCNSPSLSVTGLTANPFTAVGTVQVNWTNPILPFDDVLVVGRAGSGFTEIPLDTRYTADANFTGNGSVLYGGKVLYQGTGTSVNVTNLTAGQTYYFRVYTRTGNGWSGGAEVSATINTSNRAPVVVATSTSLTGTSPLSVTFTGNQSYDPDGNPITYEWTVDGVPFSTEANPAKVFSIGPGRQGVPQMSYSVRLTVSDNKGGISTSQLFLVSLRSASTTIDPARCYRLVSRVSGKVLSVEGSSPDDGAQVRQRTDGNLLSQRWKFESVGDGFYKIGAVHSNKALDVWWGSQENGIGLQQWTFNGNWSYQQHFALQQNTSGYFQITARHSGKALDVQQSNTEEGGMVIQYTPNGGTSQQWSLEERACTTTPPSPTTAVPPPSAVSIDPAKCYRIQSRSSGLVLNVPSGTGEDGAQLRQNTNTGQPWQKWRFTVAEGNYYQIAVLHTQKGIQVAHSATTDNAPIEQWTYWGGQHQQWNLERNAEGYFTLVNRNSKKAITVSTASQAEGGQVSQQTLTTGYHQQWSLEETTCPTGARLGATEAEMTFSLWPNPACDHVLIDLRPAVGKPVGLQLNDLMGRALQHTQLDVAPQEPYRFNTSELPNGLYLIRLTPAGQSPAILRLLIQR